MKKVLIVNEYRKNCTTYNPFKSFGHLTQNIEYLWTNPYSLNLVVFTGGIDISPSLYGEEKYKETRCALKRDIYQMMIPSPDSKIIGWATKNQSWSYYGEKTTIAAPEREIEILYFPSINALGLQYHPENMGESNNGFKLVAELVEKYLFVKLANDYSI